MSAVPWDDRVCALGEGPLWHPGRAQLFWFDITGRRLLSRDGDVPLQWLWDEMVSAAGWIDEDTLMVAGETGLWRFHIPSGERALLAEVEADDDATRSNDGRADPAGGFWFGTMGKDGQKGAGALYRYYRGEVRKLRHGVTIPNAICFDPGVKVAYWTDSAEAVVWRQPLDRAGWPSGRAETFLDLSGAGLTPDGAAVDAEGGVWIAEWGAGRVACHGRDGRFLRSVTLGTAHATCPAFGGAGLDQLFVTTATQGIPEDAMAHQPGAGMLWSAPVPVSGRPEPKVVP
jgi:sugar lactone lactonase YvrE